MQPHAWRPGGPAGALARLNDRLQVRQAGQVGVLQGARVRPVGRHQQPGRVQFALDGGLRVGVLR